MKKFKFPLQKLLEIREHKEKLIKNELAKSERKKYLLVEKKENYLNDYKKSMTRMREVERERNLTIEILKQYQQYFRRLKVSAKVQDKFIEFADEEIQLINNRLIAARKKKNVLEKLKEKKLKVYNYKLQKEEQDFFDEVGNNGFIKEQIIRSKAEKGQVKEKDEIPIKYKEYDKTITEQLYDEIIQRGENGL